MRLEGLFTTVIMSISCRQLVQIVFLSDRLPLRYADAAMHSRVKTRPCLSSKISKLKFSRIPVCSHAAMLLEPQPHA